MRITIIFLLLTLLVTAPAWALQATVTWTNPTDASRTGIRVERQDGGTGSFVNQTPTPLAASATTFNQSGLVLNTQYCYRVVTMNSLGDAAQPWPQACGTPNGAVNVNGITIIFQP